MFDIRRREFITLLFVGAARCSWPLLARPQQADSNPAHRNAASGLAASDPEAQARVTAFQQGLRELGWTIGQNLHIDFRWSTGDAAEMQTLARELVDFKPELIVGMTTPAVAALVQETKSIPIVFASIVDPVGRGFISNMARPGGNVTGILNFEFSMGGKWLETLKQVAPMVRRVAGSPQPGSGAVCRIFCASDRGLCRVPSRSILLPPQFAMLLKLERAVIDFAAKPGRWADRTAGYVHGWSSRADHCAYSPLPFCPQSIRCARLP